MSETMAKRFGDFLGEFLEYDTRIPTLAIHCYMKIRVRLDVRVPLKRRKKVQVGDHVCFASYVGNLNTTRVSVHIGSELTQQK